MDKIEVNFRFNPQTNNKKHQKMISKLMNEGWNYLGRDIVGYDKNGKANWIKVKLNRVVDE